MSIKLRFYFKLAGVKTLAVFIAFILTAVSLFPAPTWAEEIGEPLESVMEREQGNVLGARLKMIQFVGNHFLQMMNAFFWHMELEIEKGRVVDPYDYGLAQIYFNDQNRTYNRPHFLIPRFRFVSDDEFKVLGVEADRLAGVTETGKILWNLKRLKEIENFSVFEALQIITHEVNHHISKVRTDIHHHPDPRITTFHFGDPESPPSPLAKKLERSHMNRVQAVYHEVSLEQKDQFAVQLVDFIKANTLLTKSPSGQVELGILNLLLSPDQKSRTVVLGMSNLGGHHSIGIAAWALQSESAFTDETSNMELLVKTFGSAQPKGLSIHDDMQTYLPTLEANSQLIPEVKVTTVTVNDSGEARVSFEKNGTLYYDPNTKDRFSSSAAFGLEQVIPDTVAAKLIFQIGKAPLDWSPASDDWLKLRVTHDFNFKKEIAGLSFDIVHVNPGKNPNADRFLTLEIQFDEPAEGSTTAHDRLAQQINDLQTHSNRPLLTAADETGVSSVFKAQKLLIRKGKILALFKIPPDRHFTLRDLAFPRWNAGEDRQYVEWTVRPKTLLTIEAVSEKTPAVPVGSSEPLELKDLAFNFNRRVQLILSGNVTELRQAESILIEVSTQRKNKMPDLKMSPHTPQWQNQSPEKIEISLARSAQFKKSLEAQSSESTSVEIPLELEVLNRLKTQHFFRRSDGVEVRDNGGKMINSIWLKMKNGEIVKLSMPRIAVFSEANRELFREWAVSEMRSAKLFSPTYPKDPYSRSFTARFLEDFPGSPLPTLGDLQDPMGPKIPKKLKAHLCRKAAKN